MKNQVKCPYCGKDYLLGRNGTVHGCDECLKVIRDKDGIVLEWTLPQKEQKNANA